jgi:hypothetical protein
MPSVPLRGRGEGCELSCPRFIERTFNQVSSPSVIEFVRQRQGVLQEHNHLAAPFYGIDHYELRIPSMKRETVVDPNQGGPIFGQPLNQPLGNTIESVRWPTARMRVTTEPPTARVSFATAMPALATATTRPAVTATNAMTEQPDPTVCELDQRTALVGQMSAAGQS